MKSEEIRLNCNLPYSRSSKQEKKVPYLEREKKSNETFPT